MQLAEVAEADKSLSGALVWVSKEPNQFSMVASLEQDGVTMQGVQLRLRAYIDQPDRAVMMQLEYTPPSGKSERLVRIEWRPIAPHVNKGNAPDPYKFLVIAGSHVHPFALNFNAGRNAMLRPNLPVAMPIEPDPKDFGALLVFAAKELRIQDLQRIEIPEWQARIL